MSVSNFLFEGQPPEPVTEYGSTVNSMPRWMSDYANMMVSGAAGAASEPYQPYTGPRVAGATQDQEDAYSGVRSAVQNAQGPLSLAAPYLAQAGRSFTGSTVDDYMSPYIKNVTDRNAMLAGRAYNEQIMPALESKFGALGQDPRSSAYRAAAEHGSRDVMENLTSQNLAALNQGYTNAGAQFSSDATRSGQLAQNMGPLSQLDLQQKLAGAGALQSIGQEQQGQTQKSLDLAHQDFTDQRDYPWTQLNRMQQIGQGLISPPTNQNRSQDVIPNAYGPTGIDQAAGLYTGITGLLNMAGGSGTAQTNDPTGGAWAWRRGGRIRYARGGPLRLVYAR